MKPALLAILVCPVCNGPLTLDKKAQELICHADKLAFPIQDGIPLMLVTAARTLQNDTPPTV
jgi:uncharacterized protein YbaR (Trm112 family)